MPSASDTTQAVDPGGQPGTEAPGTQEENRATRLISMTKTATKSLRKGPGLLGGQGGQGGQSSQGAQGDQGAEVPAGSPGRPRQPRAHTMANRALANSLNSRPLTSRPLVNPHLRRDPRLKIWITRAIVAIVIMLGFTIGVSWRIGLTAAVIYVAADSLIRSKTTAVVPAGVRVTSAQRFTRRRLRVLQPAGYMALHARTIPGTRHVIDHLVIGPAGVFTLDSERLDRRLPLRAIGGMLYHGKETMEPRFDHATHEAKHAATLIARELGQRVRVKPVMVLYGPSIPWVIMKVKGVDVFDGSRVGTYFRRQTKAVAKHRLDTSQIAMVLAAAARALPPLQ
jgi:Nuclease-related domain